ncbi:MAG: hypothetical protein WC451_02765 [Patescibacteria group bacterium]
MTLPVAEFKVYTGASGATESPTGGATNINLMNTDAYDTTGSMFQTSLIPIPVSGTSYSYERIFRLKVTGIFNLIDNIKVWKSTGDLSDSHLVIAAAVSTTASTPVKTASAIATTTIPVTEGTALDATPSGGITASPGYTKYVYLQLQVPTTVTVFGQVGVHTIAVQYDIT